jgi:hypothetical protein
VEWAGEGVGCGLGNDTVGPSLSAAGRWACQRETRGRNPKEPERRGGVRGSWGDGRCAVGWWAKRPQEPAAPSLPLRSAQGFGSGQAFRLAGDVSGRASALAASGTVGRVPA